MDTSGTRVALVRDVHIVPRPGTAEILLYNSSKRASVVLRNLDEDTVRYVERLREGVPLHDTSGDSTASARTRRVLDVLRSRQLLEERTSDTSTDRRYDRLIAHFAARRHDDTPATELMARLQASHVLMLGQGSLASWVTLCLTSSGIGRITGVDGDIVEPSNLSRQGLLAEADVGRPKVEATRDAVRRLSTDTSYMGVPAQLSSEAEVEDVFAALDRAPELVLLTADRPFWDINVWVARSCGRRGWPLLKATTRQFGPLGDPAEEPCIACVWEQLGERFPDRDDFVAYVNGSRASNAQAQTAAHEVAVAGGQVSEDVIGYLTGCWRAESLGAVVTLKPSQGREPVVLEERCTARTHR